MAVIHVADILLEDLLRLPTGAVKGTAMADTLR